MTYARRTMTAAAVSGALVLSGCGMVSGAGTSLRADSDHAKQALSSAKAVSVTIRFTDPDGNLKRALGTGHQPATSAQADAVVGASITMTVSANNGRTVSSPVPPGLATAQQIRQSNVDLTVRGAGGRLAELRLVDGTLYASTDIAAVKRAADLASPGSSAKVDDFFASAPPALRRGADDLKAGKWLKLPLATYLDTFLKLAKDSGAGGVDPRAASQYGALVQQLRGAIRPHVGLRDLGASGSTRHVSVDIQVKDAVVAGLAVLRANAARLGIRAGAVPSADKLDGLSSKTLSATLTIKDGHYTELSVPLSGLAALDAHPSEPIPPLGRSAVSVELDDRAGAVVAPTDVSTFDVGTLINPLLAGIAGHGATRG